MLRSKDQKILITKRRPELIYPNAWVFAGGKLDKGETLLKAAKREVLEEVGIDVEGISGTSSPFFIYEVFFGSQRTNKFSHYLLFYYLFDLDVSSEDIKVQVQ